MQSKEDEKNNPLMKKGWRNGTIKRMVEQEPEPVEEKNVNEERDKE